MAADSELAGKEAKQGAFLEPVLHSVCILSDRMTSSTALLVLAASAEAKALSNLSGGFQRWALEPTEKERVDQQRPKVLLSHRFSQHGEKVPLSFPW